MWRICNANWITLIWMTKIESDKNRLLTIRHTDTLTHATHFVSHWLALSEICDQLFCSLAMLSLTIKNVGSVLFHTTRNSHSFCSFSFSMWPFAHFHFVTIFLSLLCWSFFFSFSLLLVRLLFSRSLVVCHRSRTQLDEIYGKSIVVFICSVKNVALNKHKMRNIRDYFNPLKMGNRLPFFFQCLLSRVEKKNNLNRNKIWKKCFDCILLIFICV